MERRPDFRLPGAANMPANPFPSDPHRRHHESLDLRQPHWRGYALTWKEVPTPEPGKGEVRIAIKAASLNFPDLLIVQGQVSNEAQPAFVPGAEFAGVVEAVGEGVKHLSVGTSVAGFAGLGGFWHPRGGPRCRAHAPCPRLLVRRRCRFSMHPWHHLPRADGPRSAESR